MLANKQIEEATIISRWKWEEISVVRNQDDIEVLNSQRGEFWTNIMEKNFRIL